ncbi:MAG: hypothetical protein HRT89_07440 [Lentisphaeria bacterium]|nr:CpXC domain-containing protein [Lentisphaeria bacterium]NQZ67887.1 hypothetical protein [Lentisphaeria bacterium]
MSDKNKVDVSCPACEAIQKIEPIRSVIPDSQEIAALVSGELNRFDCDSCGEEFHYECALTFIDEPNKRIIYFAPESEIPDLDDAIMSLGEIYKQTYVDMDEDDKPAMRLVRKHSYLIEKIAMFMHGFDDRLIEYLKFMLFQHNEGIGPDKFEILYDFTHQSQEELKFIAYSLETGEAEYELMAEMDDYFDLEEHYLNEDEHTEQLNGFFTFPYVQADTLLKQIIK